MVGEIISPLLTTEALDRAAEGDTIKVAAGVYTDVQCRLVPLGYNDPSAAIPVSAMIGRNLCATNQVDSMRNSCMIDSSFRKHIAWTNGSKDATRSVI